MKRLHPEDDLQKACVSWFNMQHRDKQGLLFAIPNGGKRDAREAKRMKEQGTVSGIPDIELAIPTRYHHGSFFELKVGKNKLTDNQRNMMYKLETQGYACYLIRSLDEFMKAIATYLKNR